MGDGLFEKFGFVEQQEYWGILYMRLPGDPFENVKGFV